MSEKELKETRDIKKLLVLQLIALGVKPIEIAEALNMTKGNFSTEYKARKLVARLRKNNKVDSKRKVKRVKRR